MSLYFYSKSSAGAHKPYASSSYLFSNATKAGTSSFTGSKTGSILTGSTGAKLRLIIFEVDL